MTHIDPEEERQRLAELYSQQTEEELSVLAQDSYELTEVAREALRAELVKRGLYSGQLEQVRPETEGSPEFRNLVTVRTFSTMAEAELAKGRLEAEGIDSVLFDENMGRIHVMNLVGGLRLRVDAENAEEASRVLEGSASTEDAPEEFKLPDDDPST